MIYYLHLQITFEDNYFYVLVPFCDIQRNKTLNGIIDLVQHVYVFPKTVMNNNYEMHYLCTVFSIEGRTNSFKYGLMLCEYNLHYTGYQLTKV